MVHPPGWEPPAWRPPGSPADAGSPPADGPAPAAADQPWGQAWQPGSAAPRGPVDTPGWAPPPQAGVVPLRPLGLGELLDGSVQTMRHNPRVMFGLSALVMGVAVVLSTVLLLAGLPQILGAMDPVSGTPDSTAVAEMVSGGVIGFVVPAVIQTLALAVLNGILIVAVSDAVIGRRPSPGEVLRRVGRRGAFRLLALSLLTGLIWTAIGLVASLPVVLLFLWKAAAGVLGAIVIVPAAVVLGAVVSVRLALAAPALLLEELTIVGAMRRSWRLVHGSFWRTLGILLLTGIIAGVLTNLLQLPFSLVGQVLVVAMGGEGDGSLGGAVVAMTLVTNLGAVLSAVVVSPFVAAVVSLLYIDLRIRREGLDVALTRAAGATGPA